MAYVACILDSWIAYKATDIRVMVSLKMIHSTYMSSGFQKIWNFWNDKFFDVGLKKNQSCPQFVYNINEH